MYAVKALYDDGKIKLKNPISVKGQYEVVVTFLEPVEDEIADAKQIKKNPRSEFIGSWKGKIRMADDFNEPLDELG